MNNKFISYKCRLKKREQIYHILLDRETIGDKFGGVLSILQRKNNNIIYIEYRRIKGGLKILLPVDEAIRLTNLTDDDFSDMEKFEIVKDKNGTDIKKYNPIYLAGDGYKIGRGRCRIRKNNKGIWTITKRSLESGSWYNTTITRELIDEIKNKLILYKIRTPEEKGEITEKYKNK